jgi:hypothetical protein
MTNYGYALIDIITRISSILLQLEMPPEVSAFLFDRLSTIEFRLSHGVSERLQLGSFVGAFTIARSMMSPERISKDNMMIIDV